MNRTISYDIDSHSEGLRVEQFLRRKGYSAQNLSTIKRMPESILVNGVHYYMKQTLKAGDRLLVRIQETESSRNIPPVCAPLSVVYEDEDLIVINKPAGMPIHPSLNAHNTWYRPRTSPSTSGWAAMPRTPSGADSGQSPGAIRCRWSGAGASCSA